MSYGCGSFNEGLVGDGMAFKKISPSLVGCQCVVFVYDAVRVGR